MTLTLLLANPLARRPFDAGEETRTEPVVLFLAAQKPRSRECDLSFCGCALGGIRTPNLLIRSQMLYPLSYERWASESLACASFGAKSLGWGPGFLMRRRG